LGKPLFRGEFSPYFKEIVVTPLRRSMIDAMILRGFALRAQESDVDATGFAGTGAVCNATGA